MGRHWRTYTAKLDAHRAVTIDSQGRICIRQEIESSGDRGRPVELPLTEQAFDSLGKLVQEARLRHAADQARRESDRAHQQSEQRAFQLQLEVWERDRRIKELQGVVERVHDVVHPDRSSAVDVPERSDAVARPSSVTH
jgi:hypothetical protein